MPEDKIYEFAVIRLVPKIEREEFFNIGLVMFSKQQRFLKTKFQLHHSKLELYKLSECVPEIEKTLQNFQNISEGHLAGGRIALLDKPERFRWLTAWRSAMIQTSRPHPGKCADLEATFDQLFKELVL